MDSFSMDLSNTLENWQKQIDLALIFWSIKKYSNKLISENGLEDKSRPLKSNIAKFENLLASLNIKIVDYTNQKYNEGMNIDIIDTVKTDTSVDIIRETIEPSIIIEGNLVKKARVIKEINGGENG